MAQGTLGQHKQHCSRHHKQLIQPGPHSASQAGPVSERVRSSRGPGVTASHKMCCISQLPVVSVMQWKEEMLRPSVTQYM
jgi:hypothetical protein